MQREVRNSPRRTNTPRHGKEGSWSRRSFRVTLAIPNLLRSRAYAPGLEERSHLAGRTAGSPMMTGMVQSAVDAAVPGEYGLPVTGNTGGDRSRSGD